jgi:hypothetical protein
VSIDDQQVIFGRRRTRFLARDGLFRAALNGVVFGEISEIVGGNEIVDGNNLDLFSQEPLVADGAKDKPADAPETIDANFDHKT